MTQRIIKFEDMEFSDVNGNIIEDVSEYIKQYFKKKHKDNLYDTFEIFIGTDSLPQRRGKRVQYATVICLYTKGRGAHIIYSRTSRTDVRAMYDKLWFEVEYTMTVANYLRDTDVFIDTKIHEVHLDISCDDKNGSNCVYKAAVGYVESMGFHCRTKPEAFCSSYAADHIVRGK